jgi:hypothetical protein
MRAVLIVLLVFGLLVAGGCGAQGSGGQGSGAQTSEQEEGPVPKSWEAAHGSSDDGDSGDEDLVAGKVRWVRLNTESANERAAAEEAYAAGAREALSKLREDRDRMRRMAPAVRAQGATLEACTDDRFSMRYGYLQDISPGALEVGENENQIQDTRDAAEQLRSAMKETGNNDPALTKLADDADAAAERLERAMQDRERAAEDLNRNGERIALEGEQILDDAGC